MSRSVLAGLLITASLLVVFAAALTVGSASLTVNEVAAALLGNGTNSVKQMVLEWRLPRATFAVLGGAALALSGAVFQFITRNPLGSPDIIGFSSGAYAGALIVTALGVTSVWGRPAGALAGGIVAGLLVYFLAWDRGLTGLRIIIVGIAVSVFLAAISTYLLLSLQREKALVVAGWGLGSLANIGWRQVLVLLLALAISLPLLLYFTPDMRLLDLGDDTAAGLGVRVNRLRGWLMLVGVLLVAAVTAAAGPIAFVALAAPQLAKRISGSPAIPLYLIATVGALLLLTSDVLARLILGAGELPAGVLTLTFGGAYLLWLLSRDTLTSQRSGA